MKNKYLIKSLKFYGKRKYLLFFFSIIFIGLLISGPFLSLNQSPRQADAIIILSGGQGRVEKAVELYKAGYAPYIILSNAKESTSQSGDMLLTALNLGIPKDVIYTENVAESTYQNAEFTLPLMKEHNFKSAIVVSSDFHMRRVKLLFNRMYKKSDIELTYIGSASGYKAKRWWSDRKSRETTFNEYVKMIGNTFGYNGPEAKSTLDQIKNWFR